MVCERFVVFCSACGCHPDGSASYQCNQTTGECPCMIGIGGAKCNQCARGYIGDMPSCVPCGECFDNWDSVLNDLKRKSIYFTAFLLNIVSRNVLIYLEQTKIVAENATEIMKTGASGSYLNEFEALENKLSDVKEALLNTSASSRKLSELEKKIKNVK